MTDKKWVELEFKIPESVSQFTKSAAVGDTTLSLRIEDLNKNITMAYAHAAAANKLLKQLDKECRKALEDVEGKYVVMCDGSEKLSFPYPTVEEAQHNIDLQLEWDQEYPTLSKGYKEYVGKIVNGVAVPLTQIEAQ